MSFATLEEAWGMSTLGPVGPPVTAAPPPLLRHRPGRQPFSSLRQPGAADNLPGDGELPRSASDDLDYQNTQRYLARAYARFGPGVLLKLMPPEAVRQLGVVASRRRVRRGGWNLRAMLNKPEALLFVLILAFVGFVLWDAWSPRGGGGPSMASLHMAPFSTGGS